MKTPPEKHWQRLLNVLQRILAVTSAVVLIWVNIFSGNLQTEIEKVLARISQTYMPNRKVMIVILSRVITFSVFRLTPSSPVSITPPPSTSPSFAPATAVLRFIALAEVNRNLPSN